MRRTIIMAQTIITIGRQYASGGRHVGERLAKLLKGIEKGKDVNAADKKVKWTSTDTNVASVDSNGKVTAKDAGSCIIKATTNDGGFVAQCEVSVVGFDTSAGSLDETGYVWED